MIPVAPTASFRPRTKDVLVAIGDHAFILSMGDALLLAAELIGAIRSPFRADELLNEAISSPGLPLPLPKGLHP